jgi:hypothetical protein
MIGAWPTATARDPMSARRFGQLLALAADFLGLVYAVGGGVLALRLYLADLPSRTVADQLPRAVLSRSGLAQTPSPRSASRPAT